jgi:anhydro-N-acetylmuramic acid kinase
MTAQLAIGLMSGTSCDGVDAALIRSDGEYAIEFVGGFMASYRDHFRKQLLAAAQQDLPLVELLKLEKRLTELHAAAAQSLLALSGVAAGDVAVAGFHGHTLRHLPREGLTLQIGDASRLAEQIGIPVVSDFRRRDLAAGGEGAPLAPLFHSAVFSQHEKPLAVLNLGGVSNVTWLGEDGAIFAADAGPGCGLLDLWTAESTGAPFDEDGRLALSGRIDEAIVARAMELPYFRRPPPKSADRFEFQELLESIRRSGLSPADGAATLCAITAEAVHQLCEAFPAAPRRLWISGGGAKHPRLVQLLAARFAEVRSIAEIGLRPDLLEAECFAWLALRRLRGLPTSIPSTTGCQSSTCGGLLSEGRLDHRAWTG